MTNEVQTEETPNPYNQNKSWQNENKVDFVSANEGRFLFRLLQQKYAIHLLR